jgi:hypothetical protein
MAVDKSDDEATDHEKEIDTGMPERKHLGRHVTKILLRGEHSGGVIHRNQAGRQASPRLYTNKPIARSITGQSNFSFRVIPLCRRGSNVKIGGRG